MSNITIVDCSTGIVITRAQTLEELAIVATWAVNSPPPPDGFGFVEAIKIAAGGIVAASSLPNSSLFFSACMAGAWADVQALLLAAKSSLPPALYSAIQGFAVTYNIPIII